MLAFIRRLPRPGRPTEEGRADAIRPAIFLHQA